MFKLKNGVRLQLNSEKKPLRPKKFKLAQKNQNKGGHEIDYAFPKFPQF